MCVCVTMCESAAAAVKCYTLHPWGCVDHICVTFVACVICDLCVIICESHCDFGLCEYVFVSATLLSGLYVTCV